MGRDLPIEDAKIRDRAAGKEAVRGTLEEATGDASTQVEWPRCLNTTCDRVEELAPLHLDDLAVAVEGKTGTLAGAVVGDHHVHPVTRWQALGVDRKHIDRAILAVGGRVAGHPKRQQSKRDGECPPSHVVSRVLLTGQDQLAVVFRVIHPERKGHGRTGIDR